MGKFHPYNCSYTIKAKIEDSVGPNMFNHWIFWQTQKDLLGILHRLGNNAFVFADHINSLYRLVVILPNK